MSQTQDTFIYVIQVERVSKKAPIKIGIATDVRQRIGELQVGNHEDLACRGVKGPLSRRSAERIERSIHRRFRQARIRGEWFSGRILDLVIKRWEFVEPPAEYWYWKSHGSGRGNEVIKKKTRIYKQEPRKTFADEVEQRASDELDIKLLEEVRKKNL